MTTNLRALIHMTIRRWAGGRRRQSRKRKNASASGLFGMRSMTACDFNLNPIGTGPFKFVEYVPSQRLVLEAHGARPRHVPGPEVEERREAELGREGKRLGGQGGADVEERHG